MAGWFWRVGVDRQCPSLSLVWNRTCKVGMRFRSLRSLWLLIWPPSNCIDRENLWPPILISISCCLKQLSTLDSRWSCMWVLLELQAVQVCGCKPLSSVEIPVPSLSTLERTQSIYTDQSADTYSHWLLVGPFISRPLSVACDLYQLLSDDDVVVVPIFISRRILYVMLMITEGMSWSLLIMHGHWWDVLISPFLFFFSSPWWMWHGLEVATSQPMAADTHVRAWTINKHHFFRSAGKGFIIP